MLGRTPADVNVSDRLDFCNVETVDVPRGTKWRRISESEMLNVPRGTMDEAKDELY
jgi:hypothetical protein